MITYNDTAYSEGHLFICLLLLCKPFVKRSELQCMSNTLLFVDWFYKLELRCDSIDVNCIVDRRLEKQYISLKLLYERSQYNGEVICMIKNPFYILTLINCLTCVWIIVFLEKYICCIHACITLIFFIQMHLIADKLSLIQD